MATRNLAVIYADNHIQNVSSYNSVLSVHNV